MKRLLALALSLLMLLTCAAPVLAEETEAAPAPSSIATQDFIDFYNAMAGEYGLTMAWGETPISGTVTVFTCDTMGGSPALMSSDGALLAITGGTQFDPDHVQESFDSYMGEVIVMLHVLLLAGGMEDEAATDVLFRFVNADGFVPGIVNAINTGEPMTFDFEGYPGEIGLLLAGDVPLLSFYLNLEQPQSAAE